MNYTKFKTLRIKRGISQEELAKQSGVNIRTIQSLECGARNTHRMTLENAYRLASVLNCGVTAFLNTTEIVFPDGRNGAEVEEDLRDQKAAEKAAREQAKQARRQKQQDI